MRADPTAQDWVGRAVVVEPEGVVGHAGFVHVGEQVDEEDGLEPVHELQL